MQRVFDNRLPLRVTHSFNQGVLVKTRMARHRKNMTVVRIHRKDSPGRLLSQHVFSDFLQPPVYRQINGFTRLRVHGAQRVRCPSKRVHDNLTPSPFAPEITVTRLLNTKFPYEIPAPVVRIRPVPQFPFADLAEISDQMGSIVTHYIVPSRFHGDNNTRKIKSSGLYHGEFITADIAFQ